MTDPTLLAALAREPLFDPPPEDEGLDDLVGRILALDRIEVPTRFERDEVI